ASRHYETRLTAVVAVQKHRRKEVLLMSLKDRRQLFFDVPPGSDQPGTIVFGEEGAAGIVVLGPAEGVQPLILGLERRELADIQWSRKRGKRRRHAAKRRRSRPRRSPCITGTEWPRMT